MRIATSQIYNQSVQTMDNQQAQLAQLSQELSSGTALNTPADNPIGAAQAVTLSVASATLTQYTTNQSSAQSALQLEGSTLGSVTSVMQSVKSLMIQANNGSLSDTDRNAIAQEMQSYRNQLLALANTTNGSGNAIFSGFQSTTQPFTNLPGGGVSYNGDTGQQLAQVSGSRQIQTNDSGQSVFMSVPTTGTTPVAAGASGNTGTGTISPVTLSNPAIATNNDSYTIQFAGTAAAPTYSVTDNTTVPPTVITPPTAYAATSGSTLTLNLGAGMSTTISGTPNSGDQFTVTPATSQVNSSVFATLDSVITALKTPTAGNASALANLTNVLTAGQSALQNSQTNVSMVQASVGGRGQELTALQTLTSTSTLQTQTSLSAVTSTNVAATISQFEQLQTSLSAAQKSFVQIQQMSLFQYVNP
ncbi:flagellar hook-associated protein FlgL [Trinickia mobilis]|uniref:flagellar hook-associated protein FlgL n=1 Tax=Trinickia mobilis TaxID=2816356 RepID=UPI001A8F6763|nr:flagellar hook-associated protein FlgL [Trinickia mobilis]